jgi:hypothetical protein
MMTRRRKLLLIAPFALVGMLVFIAAGGAIVRLLWNWLLPPLLGLPQITFWEALGVLALSRILFGGLGMRGYGPRSRMMDRMACMSAEERERFRQGMRARWGAGSSAGEPGGESGARL